MHSWRQILKLIYLRQYLSYSIDQKLKMSEMLMAIFLVYSNSGITSDKKVSSKLKMAAFLFDLTYEEIVPNYAKKRYFHDNDVLNDVTGWAQSRPSIFFYKWNNNIFHDN